MSDLGVQMKLVGEFGGRWRLLKTVRESKDGFSGGFVIDTGFWGVLEDGKDGQKGCVEAFSGIRGMWAVCGGRCAFEFFGGVEVGGVCAFGLRLFFYINKYLQRGLLFIYTNKCVRKYLV